MRDRDEEGKKGGEKGRRKERNLFLAFAASFGIDLQRGVFTSSL